MRPPAFPLQQTSCRGKRMGGRTLAVEVLQVAETVRKDDAAAMYREV